MKIFFKIKEEIEKFIDKNEKILVCVSGGPDSISLLYFLNLLKNEKKLKLYVAHFNHKLRGKESEEDAKFVKDMAKKNKNKFIYKSKDIKSIIKEKNLGPEKTAREERYKFIINSALKYNIAKIFLGHNKDDNIETIIFRFIKGAGAEGLVGIPQIRKINYGDFGIKNEKLKRKNIYLIRPLLRIEKSEILKFLKENNIQYRIDKTNKENIYERNKIRNELIPYIEKKFNPNFKNTVANISSILTYDNDFLDTLSNQIFENIILKKSKKNVIIDFSKYKFLHLCLRYRIIKKILKEIFPGQRKITFSLILNIDNMIIDKKNIDLPYNFKCLYKNDKILIVKNKNGKSSAGKITKR